MTLKEAKEKEAGSTQKRDARTECRQFSFLTRPIKEWNEFPPEATAAGSLDTCVSRVC